MVNRPVVRHGGDMPIHLPVVENRIAEYATRFARHGQGWVYHGDARTGGLPVSDGERDWLIAEHARLLRRAERAMRWWLPVAVIGIVGWSIWTGAISRPGDPDPWTVVPILLLPMPWVAREFWRANRLAEDLAGRRIAVTPPRGRWESASLRIAALPPLVPALLLIVSAALAVQSRPWATGEQRLWLAEALLGLVAGAGIVWLKRRGR